MLQLLKIEWMKLKNYRTFWILSILYLVSIVGANYIVYKIIQNIFEDRRTKQVTQILAVDFPYAFPKVWQATAYVSSFLLFIPGLILIIIVANEFSFKTHRQNIIDGWNRWQFISVKIVTAVFFALISTVVVIITAILFGTIEGSNSFTIEHSIYVLYYLIQAVSYIIAALLIVVFVRRSGLALGVYILYTQIFENVLWLVLNHYFGTAGDYLPLQSTDELIPFPAFENIKRQVIKQADINLLFISAAIYLAAYLYIIRRKFLKADL